MYKYYGNKKKKNYFEGWYFKIAHKALSFALIPGMHIDQYGEKHAFIQVITEEESYYIEYAYDTFYFDEKKAELRIGRSVFSEKGMMIHVDHDGYQIKGKILFKNQMQLQYDIMGIFAVVPFMECRHTVVGLDHDVCGRIKINGQKLLLDGGRGYIEGDRGCSFPKSYVWTQCNYFDFDNCSVMAAVAEVPFCGIRFLGCICVVCYQGKTYRLATYLGAKVIYTDDKRLCIKQGRYILKVLQLKDNKKKLKAPSLGSMSVQVHESVACVVRYRFYKNTTLLFDQVSKYASFEAHL